MNRYMTRNLILMADYYKHTHHLQNPSGTRNKYSYCESRGVDTDVMNADAKVKFFGHQAMLMEYLEGSVISREDVDEAAYILKQGFGADYFDREPWDYIVREHNGRLPIRIRALDEGTEVNPLVPLFDIEITDEKEFLAFLPSFLEDVVLRGTWYPTTVCTLSNEVKKVIKKYCDLTGCTMSPFHLNDFGARGVSSHESAGLGGMAHLVNFLGTDTIEGVQAAMRFYGAPVCGFSVVASEHSTTTPYGLYGEKAAFEKIIRSAKDHLPVSLVVDSYNTEHAIKNILGKELKSLIMSRKGKTVCRPDSGVPWDEAVKACQLLGEAFGFKINEKGFKELDPHVGVIYGDGINYYSIIKILDALVADGWAVSNVIFGMGGKLLQGVTRDSLKFALKCSSAKIIGNEVDVYKNPVTDTGKKSKRGRVAVVKDENGELIYVPEKELNGRENMLKVTFENGRVMKRVDWADIAAKW